MVDQRHLADHAQRDDHRAEVLLRRHARPRRADGQDAAGARAAHAAGGPEPRGGRPPDRRSAEPEVPDGAVGCLRRRPARQRGDRAQGRRHRQPAHDAARRAGQGPQGPLRHALAGAARAAARLVARGPCPGQDAAQRVAVPRAQSDGPADARASSTAPSMPLPRPRRSTSACRCTRCATASPPTCWSRRSTSA